MITNHLAVIADDLGRAFGTHRAVDGVNFEVPAGTVLGLLGPNGAGKTTVVRLLSTILTPTSGRGIVLGYDVARQPEQVRLRIGLAGQYATVDDALTARENLTMVGRLSHLGRKGAAARSEELLERFRLTGHANRPLRTFSGGMRRRIDLAAALVRQPPLVFLDEPTTGLDPRSRVDLWEVVEELVADGTTVVLTTQYLEEADRLADNIVVIADGCVAASGTVNELKARIGTTVLELGFADKATAWHARAALAGRIDTEPTEMPTTIACRGDASPAMVHDVLNFLADVAGVNATSIDVRRPTLDDVFLRLTNQSLTTTDAAEAVSDVRGVAA
jgi:ABC-2 type transport system ATP-binding protein